MTAVNTAQAASALAYELQSSKQQQLIIAEEINVELGKKYLLSHTDSKGFSN